MMRTVRKLILPVAGLGKRLKPLTLTTPKNLLPVNGKPLIEYVLEEAAASGIKEVILVVNPKHREDFKEYLGKHTKQFPSLRFRIRVQETPGGNGHAIVQAKDCIGNEPFAVRFCDDIILTKAPVLQSLVALYEAYRAPVLLLERIPRKLVSRFGVVAVHPVRNPLSNGVKNAAQPKGRVGGKIFRITKIVEKPPVREAPSNLIIVGGYVLSPRILQNLSSVADSLPTVADDALPLAVALQIELIVGGKVYGWEFPGRRLDCGTLDGLMKTEEFLNGRISSGN